MAFSGVLRPGHVMLRVLDMEASLFHYKELIGLQETGRDDKGRVYLKGWDEHDHHSVVLIEADAPGMDHMAFKVLNVDALADFEKRLEAYGCEVKRIPAGEQLATGQRIRFEIPTGHQIELYAEKERVGNGLPDTNPDVWPDGLKGMHPTRFDHCLVWGDDVKGSTELFTRVLGFSLTEQIVSKKGPDGQLLGAFLSCSNKPHDIAFIHADGKNWFHHVSFWLNSWDEVRVAADIIAKNKVPVEYGPGRHGITRGLTIYFFDPSGNRNEVFSEGYFYYPDHPTITWTADELGKGIFYYGGKMVESFSTAHT